MNSAHDPVLMGTTSDLWSSTSHQNYLFNKYQLIWILHLGTAHRFLALKWDFLSKT